MPLDLKVAGSTPFAGFLVHPKYQIHPEGFSKNVVSSYALTKPLHFSQTLASQ